MNDNEKSNGGEMSVNNKLSRRSFIGALASSAAALLAACRPQETAALPTATPSPEPTFTPSPTTLPTAIPTRMPTATPTVVVTPTTQVRKVDMVKAYPDAVSQVVQARHAGVWSGDTLSPEALRKMLDASITQLTGLNDTIEAWKSLFSPDEKIAIKVNAFRNSRIWTHVPLVQAVTDSLQEAGIPPEQIIIFDYYTSELSETGFTVNKDGPGVRCDGTDDHYTHGWQVEGVSAPLSNILLSCDALINMPVLKSHMLTGFTFALKNHYGTISNPDSFHGSRIDRGMPGLNLLEPIRNRTRLIIGDALAACLRYSNSYPYWKADWKGDSILMSFDPLAQDAVGFDLFSKALTADGGDLTAARARTAPWLKNGMEMGLGMSDLDQIKLTEIKL